MGGWSWTAGLVPVVLLACLTGTMAISKNFVNSSLPDSKYTFVVNFDFSQVICQHSEDKADLHVHEMSILCDGKQDCFTNPAIHDESFPYCEKKCNSTCNDRGACLYDGQQAQCYCNSGFSGPSCELIDKNECLERPCHLMADCLNTPVGYSCACRPGFYGDGYHCADLDECSTPTLCPEHSTCVNLPGTYYCNCSEGFAQKGDSLRAKCLDIDECQLGTHKCTKGQLCENTVGSYTCVSGCTEGYELVNGECKDIDECKRVDLCGARAECFNSPGSYSCVCEEGMTGDGLTCEPITDCSQRENVCDRHAYCLTDFKMCVCAAGFAGDGITCNDVNECEAKAEPCKKQKGTRCVNIVGGHICCAEGSNDERCIEEQGVFCAGGCGAHAYCGNKTCECLPGYSGDPLKKCLDVNECDADGICSGVGQWCVNVMGSFLCCSEHSKEPECQGYHVFTSIDGTTAILQTNSTKQIVVSNEQGEKGVSHHGGFIAVGKGVISKNGSIPSISVLSKRPCSTYCPYNSECVNGYCECSKGFGGNVHLGCEDINECLAGSPCGEETADSWCANTEGSFVCCTRNSSEENCWGLEIFRDADGRVHLSTNQDDDQTFAVALNETDREEFISHTIHEFQNSSEGGAILVVKQRVPTDVAMLKPNAGEMGLEIVGDDIRKETATPEQPTQNTLTPDSPIGANGIVSTLGGLSTTTTSIPVTEILVHTAEKTTLLFKNATTVLVLPSTLSPVEGSSSRSVEDGDMLGKATTSDGHINVRFTTLEEINKNPNETKTTPGPKTVIDGDGTGEESLLSAQKGIGKNVTDGDGTGDVKVVDTLVGTTKSPNKKEVDSEKEGLEIVALPTKPPTETRLEENPGPRTTVSEAEPATSSPTTDFEEGSGDKPKIADKPKITDGEKEGKEKAEKTGTKTVISDREETGTGGPTHLTITSSGEQKAPETDVHGGVGSELIAGESSATPITDETGLEIVWKGTPTPSLRSSETTVSPTGSTTSEGIATGSSGSSSSASSGTVVSPSSKEHEPKDGHKQLTITSSGEQRPPETDIHSDDGSESDEGSSGKATTEATTGKIGLEIVGGSTTPLGSSVSDTDLPTVFSTLAGQDPSSDGSSPRTTPSGISSSTKGRQETKTTSSSSTVGGQEASTASSSPSYSTAAETKSTLSGVPSTTPTVLENSTASESEAPSGHQENKTEPSEPSTTGESGSFGSGSNVTIISGSTPEPGTTREGRLHASIGPKTESTTPEAGLEIIPVPTEPITPKSSTVSGQDKIPELMTSETTGSSTPESTAETGLEIIAVTTTSGSISSLSLAATSTESPVSESTAPSVTESSSIGETGLEIVGTSLKPTEATTTQHDLVLSVSPKSEGSSSTTKVVPIVEPVTAAGKIIEPSSTTEQPEIVMSVSTTKRTVKPTGSTESVSTIPVTTDGFTSSASPVTTPNATGPVSSTSEGSIKTPEAATTVSVTPGKTSTDTAETTKKPDGVTTVAVTPEKTSELTFSSSPASISSELPTPESTRSTPEKSTTETDVEMITTEPDVDLTAKPNRAPAEPEATTKDSFELVTPSTPAAASLAPNNVKKCVSSDECGNDALCERRTGACRCLPGFEGTPSTAPCTDVDECAAGLHKCHETARCHNIIGTYACFCPMGYRKNELGVCVDINECEESRGNCCSSNGTCVNKEGSYGCECKPGFIGDGYKCMPLEKRSCSEAELAKAGCGSHHVCMVDGSGTADCNTCSMGFKLVEGKCSDINECSEPELNMCSKNADCNNLLGTYACSCRSGFKGDGYICEDIDECSTSPCHPQAECENLFGSFKCSCPSGFTGDGLKECKNPLERSCENVKEFCGRVEHTACLSVRIFNGSLSSVCECEPGYRINKETNQCEDINECDENRHNCDPASSVCVNEYGGFRCDCAEGYEGAGGVCVDVNECERGTAGCHAMAMCLNQPGSCGCKCMSGFTGDGTQCNPMQKREEDNSCTAEWDRLCLLENKTCHVDEEDVPQCGSCIEGHHPINGSCQPVHGAGTCADPSKNTCHKNAECIDIPGTPGKHFCTCKKGFIGDGIRCDGPNCHLNAGLCQKDAECTMDGLCKCKKGFDGDGFKDCKELTGSSTAPEIAAAPPSMTPISFETTELPMPTTEQEGYDSTTEKETTTTATTQAPSIVTDDGVEVRTEAVGTRKEHPQREGLKRCSTEDRSKCHEFAICDLSTSSCRCKDGFEGDGYRVCRQVASLDCVFNSTVCHSDAFCDRHTRKCSCATGYIGDGILCSPDPQDCILRKLCSTDAVCSGRRCRCVEGFTGDGIKCVSLHQRSANCSECDVNAHCNQGVCACNTGYFGNGLCCVPDPRDCVHFPGTCHPEATCNRESRQCICRRGYLGDGISCFPTVSCVTEASVCHRNAICLPSGHCMCRNGFQGNGHSCQPTSAIGLYPLVHDTPSLCGNRCNKESELCIEGDCVCKHGFKKIGSICQDVDECLALPCHNLASCQNTKGSYSCSCPEGYVGDGKTCVQHLKIGELGVFCENDGMTLVLSNDTQMFEGKMYVRGQAENPNCIKTFSPLQQHSRPYTFKVFFEHCNVQLLENNTFAATVIVQKHPHFITTSADSYDLKCTYSPGVAQVHSHVNVSELAPTSTLSNQFDGPTCSLKITDDHQDFVESAKVGQSMVLRLEVAPNGTFGILPRDCVAVNIETGERYQLTDKHGCAVDDQLFPEFSQVSASSTQAVFRTFKWPDSSMIRFQCDCKACVGPCPAPDCRKRALPRFRRAHFDEDIDQEVEGLNKVVDTNRKAFSRLLTVHEDSQELLAQEEVEHWNRARSVLSESLPSVSDFEAEGVCVRTAVLAGAALLLLLSVGFLTSTALRRRSTPPKSPSTPISVISL